MISLHFHPASFLKPRLCSLTTCKDFSNLLFLAERFTSMSAQTKLSNFFKPIGKRCSGDSPIKSPKKVKVDKENELDFVGDSNTDKENSGSPEGKTDESPSSITCSSPCQRFQESTSSSELQEQISVYCERFQILDRRMGPSWFKALQSEFDKPYFKRLNDFICDERKKNTIFPSENTVWTWTRQCSIDSVKVVILGQDPYHNPGQAHGLCFSVPVGVTPPPSLQNIYKELETDIAGFKHPGHGYLVGWARQGVLLLNAVLTVRQNSPNSHRERGWEELTTAVIRHLNQNNSGVVFLLWGAYAQKKAHFVDLKKHLVLKTVHPSPLSASRGFFNSKHFSKCNAYLEEQGKRPIDWTKLPKK